MSAHVLKIKNISRQPVSVRLNSGEYRHIPPSKETEKIFAVEVENNKAVSKLASKRLIELTPLPSAKQAKSAARKPKSKTGKGKKAKK